MILARVPRLPLPRTWRGPASRRRNRRVPERRFGRRRPPPSRCRHCYTRLWHAPVHKPRQVPGGLPHSVAPVPPRGSSQTLTFPMATDTEFRRPDRSTNPPPVIGARQRETRHELRAAGEASSVALSTASRYGHSALAAEPGGGNARHCHNDMACEGSSDKRRRREEHR